MIKITNGRTTLSVTRGSFRSMYQKQGFIPLEEDSTVSESAVGTFPTEPEKLDLADSIQQEIGEESEAEEPEEERKLEEIPLSEMDYYQLSAYADQLGVDRTGLRSTKDLRRVIRAALKGE